MKKEKNLKKVLCIVVILAFILSTNLASAAINGWSKLIPGSGLDRGFDSFSNIATRGATVFSVDNKLYIGTESFNLSKGKTYNGDEIEFPYSLPETQDAGFIDWRASHSDGCEVWRYDGSWHQLVGNKPGAIKPRRGFGDHRNWVASAFTEFNGKLYVGTWNCHDLGCQVWKYDSNTNTWTKVVQGGFGSDQAHRNNVAVMCAKVFKGKLYIGTMNWQTGCEVYRSNVSNPSSNSDWERVVNKGFKDFGAGTYYYKNCYAWSMEVFKGSDKIERLYVGTFNPKTGFHVYRTSDGTSWSYVTKNGFDYSLDWGARTMKEFKGKLYVGTARNFISGANAGCTIWRSSTGNPGSFSKVATNGFGNKYNRYAWSMEEYDAPNGQKQLWVGTANVRLTYSNPRSEGCEVWFSDDGTNWHLSVDGGFGNKYNEGARTLKSYDPPGSHPNGLYMGTYHLRLIGYTNGGCEVWRRETAGSSS